MTAQDARLTTGKEAAQARPKGLCWYGCGRMTTQGRYFLPYHDRKTEATLVKVAYGSIANMLARGGYSPENSVVGAAGRSGTGRLRTGGSQPESRASITSVQSGMALARTIRKMAWRQSPWASETVRSRGAEPLSVGLPAWITLEA